MIQKKLFSSSTVYDLFLITKGVTLIFLLTILISCNNIKTTRIVKAFKQEIIVMPTEMIKITDGTVTSIKNYTFETRTLIQFYDESDCSSCTISHLSDNIARYKYLSDSTNCDVVILFSPLADDVQDILADIIDCGFEYPIYLDQYGEFSKLNPIIPQDKKFHSFTVNRDGQPIFIGNPLNNQKLWEIFIKTVEEDYDSSKK